ncbi:MAG: hypothetical protein DRP82_06605 [Planctomycetota bacterium]|nr:MAG: hypothetical protein DRP82_06605 [Planctomycetota bacterium]
MRVIALLAVATFAGSVLIGCQIQKRKATAEETVESVRDALDAVMEHITEGDEWFGKAMRAPDPLVKRRFLNIALDHYCTARRLLLEQISAAADPSVRAAHKKLLWAVEGCLEKAVYEMPLLD